MRYSSRKAKSVWSKINKETVEGVIRSGRMGASGLARVEEAKKSGSWYRAYTNMDTKGIPPDLEEALRGNADAWGNFQKFANTYRNMYVEWVNSEDRREAQKKD